MDITALSTPLTTANLQAQVSTQVLKKTMDTNEVLGQGLIKMMDSAAMELSVNPSVGANLDIRV